MIKGLIVTDLDGTLLDKDGHYSEKTRLFMRELGDLGYRVVLASGRPFRAMKHVYEDLECYGPYIAYNGALVSNPTDPAFVELDVAFPQGQVRSIVEKAKPFINLCMVESRDTIYCSKRSPYLERYFPAEDMDILEGPIEENLDENAYTCLFDGIPGHYEDLKKIVDAHPGIALRSWNNSNISELYIPNVDKGSALAYIAKAYGVAKEDIYVFGDASNDYQMLAFGGHSFLMPGNKSPELEKFFPLADDDVNHDGVMKTLRRLLDL